MDIHEYNTGNVGQQVEAWQPCENLKLCVTDFADSHKWDYNSDNRNRCLGTQDAQQESRLRTFCFQLLEICQKVQTPVGCHWTVFAGRQKL